MKVLHFYKTFGLEQFGGVEMFIRHLTHATATQGCENTVLSLAKEPMKPVTTSSFRLVQARQDLHIASTGFSWSSLGAFASLAKQADVIHYHFPWPFMDLVHLLKGLGKPSVVTYHSDIVRQKALLQLYRPLMRAFLGRVDSIAATSPNYLESSTVLQRYQDKACAIPIGLEQDLYPRPDVTEVAKLHRRYGERFFLFVGVLRYYKGLHYLLEAMKAASWPLLIVGAGPLEQELMQMAVQHGLSNVHFLGQVSEQEKIDLMWACYGVIFPSHLRSEAFGIGLLEGAMMGKPLICSEIGTGTSFINQHEETGIVVPPADASALRQAMQTLWDDPALAARYGEAARARFLATFTARGMGEAYAELYARVAGQQRTGQSPAQ
ncbi:glycosyltransferase [Pseudomonas nitroreducens]|uniref:glycosyltransferase n=1 Tax=Pseudomonas nitroreducens TaxID=46680 RepID=UPI001FB5E487|nr:glycosyltransferase [Pseudomonas nitroreducens]MCJ1881962.1 glycosyltransferase [Pseudomonas nitroreducens]MCJ1895488.1 glycosyltransferase [Pseudomonas nitroreducens]